MYISKINEEKGSQFESHFRKALISQCLKFMEVEIDKTWSGQDFLWVDFVQDLTGKGMYCGLLNMIVDYKYMMSLAKFMTGKW